MGANADVIRRWCRQVWCAPRDVSLIDALLADDLRQYGVGSAEPRGKEDLRAFHAGILATFRDFRIDVTQTIEAGDTAAYCADATGIHIETGVPVKSSGSGIVKFRDGQIYETPETWDFSPLLAQIGAVPEDAVARALTGGATAGA